MDDNKNKKTGLEKYGYRSLLRERERASNQKSIIQQEWEAEIAKASRNTIYNEELPINNEIDNYIRLMFYGGSENDDATFHNAALNVNRDYSSKAKLIHIKGGGNFIVEEINAQPKNKVQSIDFFTHGNQTSLLFKLDNRGKYQELYISNDAENEDKGAVNGADIGEIHYSVFTNNAKIEIHGCNAADAYENPNLASELSRRLYKAGKKNAVVIGHGTYANPNRPSSTRSDYRHGLRRVYHAGRELFITKKYGRITATDINGFLRLKIRQGVSYFNKTHKL